MALHCSECGSLVSEGANYCPRCGAFVGDEAGGGSPGWRVGETGELEAVQIEPTEEDGAVLVVRSGGGRAGESFLLLGDRMTIGRRPDSSVFLDDITVSRDHAVLVRRSAEWWIDDCGSLNGTYVNRNRIDSLQLGDGDELQVGKYRLAFLHR
ncbi:MAG: FHA domain-containing protein [Actinomycetes bacterium]